MNIQICSNIFEYNKDIRIHVRLFLAALASLYQQSVIQWVGAILTTTTKTTTIEATTTKTMTMKTTTTKTATTKTGTTTVRTMTTKT